MQTDISFFSQDAPDVEPDETTDAKRRDYPGGYDPDTSADDNRQCVCGAHVSVQFVRVMGPKDGAPKACPECASGAQLRSGAAVHGHDGGRGSDVEQPTEHGKAARERGRRAWR